MNGISTRKLIEQIREAIPGVTIRTTLISGYPGETQQEFQELLNFIETYRFDRLGVFPYSHEEGTHAFNLKDNIPPDKKKGRVDELMALQESISLSLNQEKQGRRMKVIVDRKDGDYFIGRTEFDSPEVDNEVLIPVKNIDLIPGSFCEVKIIKAESFDLYAELV